MNPKDFMTRAVELMWFFSEACGCEQLQGYQFHQVDGYALCELTCCGATWAAETETMHAQTWTMMVDKPVGTAGQQWTVYTTAAHTVTG